MEAEFLYNPVDKGLYCHAPTLLETATGDLLAAWYTYPDEEYTGASLALARRSADQIKWDSSENALGPFDSSVGNPVLFQEPEGRVWLLFVLLKGRYCNDAILKGVYSEDGGRSWSSPMTIWSERGMMVRHPPVLFGNGSLLLPAYDEVAGESVLLSSRRPYTQWKMAYRFSGFPLIQPVLTREGPHRLTLFFRPSISPHIY